MKAPDPAPPPSHLRLSLSLGSSTDGLSFQVIEIELTRPDRLIFPKVDPQKQPILEACSHYLLVSRDPEAIPLWQEFCRDRGNLHCLAILHTSPEGQAQVLRDSPELEMHWDPAAALPVKLLREVRNLVVSAGWSPFDRSD